MTGQEKLASTRGGLGRPCFWLPIATAATSSIAVERAALLPPDTPLDLPCPLSALSERARSNLSAVSRALSITLPGIKGPPCRRRPRSLVPLRAGKHGFENAEGRSEAAKVPKSTAHLPKTGTSSSKLDRPTADRVSLETAGGGSSRKRKANEVDENPSQERPSARQIRPVEDSVAASPDAGEPQPTVSELESTKTLSQWAGTASHSPPPSAALSTVLAAQNPLPVMKALFPSSLSVEAASALLAAIVDACGTRVASVLAEVAVFPRIAGLSSPAPRDLMEGVVSLARAHWRAIVPLYTLIGKGCCGKQVGGPSAEVLVRCSAELPSQGAKDALSLSCGGAWKEESIPVIEALLTKCKDDNGVADLIVPSLERSVTMLEKSVRFGKLLFYIVKEVRAARQTHATSIRSVASKSKVYLAKRAVTLLDKPER